VMVGLGAAGYTLTSKSTAAAGVALFSALGAILLMHCFEGNYPTVQMLRSLLPWLAREGYRCVTVSELFARKGCIPQKGRLYSDV